MGDREARRDGKAEAGRGRRRAFEHPQARAKSVGRSESLKELQVRSGSDGVGAAG